MQGTMTRNTGAIKTVFIALIVLGWLYTMYKYHETSEKLQTSRQVGERIRKEQEKLSSKLQGNFIIVKGWKMRRAKWECRRYKHLEWTVFASLYIFEKDWQNVLYSKYDFNLINLQRSVQQTVSVIKKKRKIAGLLLPLWRNSDGHWTT